AYFVKDSASLVQTFEITPEYLKTPEDERVNNYRDWGVPLGRRFRALKLWFVLRSYGLDRLQAKVRDHLKWAQELKSWVVAHPDFELMAPVEFGLVCFRFHPTSLSSEAQLEQINATILRQINDEGKLYLTQTRLKGQYVIRFSIGQTHTERRHVLAGWEEVQRVAKALASNFS
ncbi:MAG: pyridoxal-dependent decarboxylase, partial [Bacteroidota bacterium]